MAKKQQEPPFGFDFTKMMWSFDPSRMAGEFAEIAGRYGLPGVDIDSLVDSQRKNIDALTAASRAAMEGAQALATRQTEMVQETLEQVGATLDKLSHAISAQDAAAVQTEVIKEAYEKAIANMRELAELMVTSNRTATQAIEARISESLDEIKALAEKTKRS